MESGTIIIGYIISLFIIYLIIKEAVWSALRNENKKYSKAHFDLLSEIAKQNGIADEKIEAIKSTYKI